MARLKKAEKIFIVRSLAQFMEPSLVVEAVKENFKIDVSRQQVECYDPTKTAGADLSQELVDLFHEARQKYIDQPIYNIIGANDIIQLQILSDLLVSKKGKDRKSTRLNSSHHDISYAVFCLKKKKTDCPLTYRSH